MKTKTILQMLAAALLMPTMLLTTACSNNDDEIVNTENPTNTKGYALPVTVNVTRQGGDATRATYDESTRKLSFSTGDKLFIEDYQNFAGMLTMVSDGKFSGEILTKTPYTGTVEELFASASQLRAYLLPAGYEEYGFLNIANKDTYQAYLWCHNRKVFALTKKEAVEQLSFEKHWDYDTSIKGFELMPGTAILNFTISGLAANTAVSVSFEHPDYDDAIPVNITTDASGVATFAAAMYDGDNFDDYSLTVDGFAIALPENKEVEAGKIYNMSRPVPGVKWNSTDISGIHTSWEGGSVEIGGITFACDGNVEFNGSGLYSMEGDISFTSSLGNIKKIEIKHSGLGSWYGAEGFPGWPSDYDAEGGTFTWEGTPVETVKLPENTGWGQIEGITSIVFTLE